MNLIAGFDRIAKIRHNERQTWFCLDEQSLVDRVTDRILTLVVTGEKERYVDHPPMQMRANLFNYLFKIFIHIQRLKFYQNSLDSTTCVYFTDQASMFSSTLVELHINLYRFKDFLHLLNGRFDHLRKLIVLVFNLWRIEPIPIDTVSQERSNNHRSTSDFIFVEADH